MKEHNYDVGVRDAQDATPLHFAVLRQEFMNVQVLINFGADVNAQDKHGLAPLHLAVMRLAQNPDDYDVYKKIIKELLFNGANRELETLNGLTARDQLDEIQEELYESDYQQLRSILTFSRPCLCFMRRRPMQKMHRSPMTMIFGIVFNMIATAVYYIWLSENAHGSGSNWVMWHDWHIVGNYLGLALFLINLPLFVAAVMLEPGYLVPVYDFTRLVEVALEIGLHLDNFCSYCEVIKSETSFHCTICNRCVELFDHHCPFINNCLGYRNHKYFLLFIFLYPIYLLILLSEVLRHFIEIYRVTGFECIYTDSMTTIALLLILLHLPVFFF